MKKIGRNESCPCGSGKKYKKCCYPETEFPIDSDEQIANVNLSNDKPNIFNAPDTEIGLFDAGYTVKKHYANEVIKAIHFKSNVPDAIRHLIIEHGLSIKEIEIGVNQIIETEKASGNTQAEIDFKDWKKYAEGIND
jgi:hypothetical protein